MNILWRKARTEAIRFQSEAIGTEHMLLAILRERGQCCNAEYLLTLNVNIQKIMQDTLEVLGDGYQRNIKRELQEAYQRKRWMILDQYGSRSDYAGRRRKA